MASILVVIALWLVGPNHASTQGARSVELVEKLRSWREAGELPGGRVAAKLAVRLARSTRRSRSRSRSRRETLGVHPAPVLP